MVKLQHTIFVNICTHLTSLIVLRYDIKAPSLFKVRQVGKTLVNRWNINLTLAHQLKAISLYMASTQSFSGPPVQGSPPMVSRAASTRSLLLICRTRTTPRGRSESSSLCARKFRYASLCYLFGRIANMMIKFRCGDS